MVKYYVQIEVPSSFAGKTSKTVSLTVTGESAVAGTVVTTMEMIDLATGGTKPVSFTAVVDASGKAVLGGSVVV